MESTAEPLTRKTTISTRAALWNAFVTVFVIGPVAMLALWALLVTLLFGDAGFPTSIPIIKDIPSLVWAALLIWFVHSLGVSIWTQSRKKSSLMGLVAGWLFLSAALAELLPEMYRILLSSDKTTKGHLWKPHFPTHYFH